MGFCSYEFDCIEEKEMWGKMRIVGKRILERILSNEKYPNFKGFGENILGNLCGNERKVYGRVGIVKKNLVFCGIEQGENILGNYLWN